MCVCVCVCVCVCDTLSHQTMPILETFFPNCCKQKTSSTKLCLCTK